MWLINKPWWFLTIPLNVIVLGVVREVLKLLGRRSGIISILKKEANVLISGENRGERVDREKVSNKASDGNCVISYCAVSPRTKDSGRGLSDRWRTSRNVHGRQRLWACLGKTQRRPSWWRDLKQRRGRGYRETKELSQTKGQGNDRRQARRMSSEEQRKSVGRRSWTLNRSYPYSLVVKRIGDRCKR